MPAHRSKARDVYPEIFRIDIRLDQDQLRKLRMPEFRSPSFAVDQFDITQRKRQHATAHAMTDQNHRARRVVRAQNFHDLARAILVYEHDIFVMLISEEAFL